jgi:hypothetical protein
MGTTPARPKGFLVLAVLLALFALGTIGFWIEFFTSGMVSMAEGQCYMEHELSFPAADGYMSLCALICAVGLVRQRSWALLFGLLAGSGAIFLGLMDLFYSTQRGIFSGPPKVAGEAIFICAVCLAIGVGTIVYLWRNRSYLL